jgi:heme-degrading monooxygenase HmoA
MIVVLFRSKLTPEAGADYKEMAQEMYSTAHEIPGFIDFKSFTAEDGERLAIVRWKDHETLKLWREHPRHREAQKQGRAKWYEYYKIEIAEVVRDAAFERKHAETHASGQS